MLLKNWPNATDRGGTMIIDFHTHTFPEKVSAKVVDHLGKVAHIKPFTDGSLDGLRNSMETGHVNYSVNLPVMTSPDQVETINSSIIASNEIWDKHGIISFGGLHPVYENYKAELRRLRENHVPGIKLHPAYQNIDLDDIRMMRIIDYASEQGLIVSIHAGIDIGIYDHNYSSVSHIIKIMDEVHPDKLVLAHMGNWGCWDEVEEYLTGAPLWLDTSFSIGPITPNPEQDETPYSCILDDDAFLRIIRKHGSDKILFGTDSPWKDQKDYVERIQTLSLTDNEKRQIFSENAISLLKRTM